MIEPKITMMSCKDDKLSGKVVLNGHEIAVQPFKVASDASASDKVNKLIERAISVKRKAVDKQEIKLMDWVEGVRYE